MHLLVTSSVRVFAGAALLALSASALGGCAVDASDDDTVVGALALTDQVTTEAQLVRVLVPRDLDTVAASSAAVTQSELTSAVLADAIVHHAQSVFLPASCVTAKHDGDETTLELDHCAVAPNAGFADVSVTLARITFVVSRVSSRTSVQFTQGVVALESAETARPLDGAIFQGTAALVADTNAPFLIWTSEFDSRHLALQIREDLECTVLAGSISGIKSAATTALTLEDFQACGKRCPVAGHPIKASEKRTDGTLHNLDMVFDGSAAVQVATNGAAPHRVPLKCTP